MNAFTGHFFLQSLDYIILGYNATMHIFNHILIKIAYFMCVCVNQACVLLEHSNFCLVINKVLAYLCANAESFKQIL